MSVVEKAEWNRGFLVSDGDFCLASFIHVLQADFVLGHRFGLDVDLYRPANGVAFAISGAGF